MEKRSAPLESTTVVGGVQVPSNETRIERGAVDREVSSSTGEISPLPPTNVQRPPPRSNVPRTRGGIVPSPHIPMEGGNTIWWRGGALIVETRRDAALRINPGASIPFTGGLSSTDNRSILKVSRDGHSFTVTAEGLYRLVLDLEVVDGAPSTLKVECASLPEEHSDISTFRLKNNGERHLSTILSFVPGTSFSLVNVGEGPLTLAPSVRLQLYRVG